MKKLYYNGTILTMDTNQPKVEAVLIENGTILAVGALKSLEPLADDAERIDLEGKTMLPGFIDSHSHITMMAMNQLVADLSPESGVTSIADLMQCMRQFWENTQLDEDEWLIGMGYNELAFEEKQHPTKFDLDQISKEKPILCTHVSGHICVANSKALELFGYHKGCPEVPGGVIRRVAGTDEPDGVLEETAFQSAAFTKAGLPKPAKIARAIIETEKLYASYGFTTVSEISCLTKNAELLAWMAEQKQHLLDVVIHCLNLDDIARLGRTVAYKNRFRVNGAKLVLDGSPQAKTAWLSQPYYQPPEGSPATYCGYPSVSDEELHQWLKRCVENQWPAHLHCNGDAASEQFLRVYEQVWQEAGCPTNQRPVMIHCQTVRDDQLERMQRLGMAGTFFVGHIHYWGDLHYESVLGPDRANRISPLRSAVQTGVNYTLHQDSPITKPDMLLSIHVSVNRQTQKGRILGNEQRLTVEEALKAATINAAYQYFEEDKKGSITPGKLADFVILEQNPLEIAPEQIKNIKVQKTIKEGTVIFQINNK